MLTRTLGFKHCLAIKLFLFGLSILCWSSAYAQDSCGFLVVSNEPEARVEVDGRDLGTNPTFIPCDSESKELRVIPPQGQVFQRYLPSRDRVSTERTKKLKVVFSPALGQQGRDLASQNNGQTSLPRVVLDSNMESRINNFRPDVAQPVVSSEDPW